MSSLPRKRSRTASPPQPMVDPNKHIICQTTTPEQHTSSTENGRARIVHAAGVRKDIVFQRLKQIDHSTIVYHVSNHCYKHYTHAKSLEKSSSAAGNQSLPQSVPSIHVPGQRSRRSMTSSSRDPVCLPEEVDVYSKKCVICGNAKRHNTCNKYHISEKMRAEVFLKAASVLQDDVFTQVCDLQDANAVFSADLYCHKDCIRGYLRKTELLLSKQKPTAQDTSEKDQDPSLKNDSGVGKCNVPGEMDFRKCGAMLREFLKQDSGLNDKFCDASELEFAYNNIAIPSEIADFLSPLFDIEITSTARELPKLDSGSDSSKMRKVLAVYQIMFFILNNGRKRTQLHMMNTESIHSVCRSKTLISSLNKFGLVITYDELMRYHSDMASYVTEISRNHVPFPSHFNPSEFTIGALDNFDHEEGTLSGIGGSHDTVQILMQDKPQGVSACGKPNVSETNVTHRERQFKQELACQELRVIIKLQKNQAFLSNIRCHRICTLWMKLKARRSGPRIWHGR